MDIYAKGILWSSLMYQILMELNTQLDLEKKLREAPNVDLLKGVSLIRIMDQLSSGDVSYLKEVVKDLKDFDWQKLKNNTTEALEEALETQYEKDKAKETNLRTEKEKNKKKFEIFGIISVVVCGLCTSLWKDGDDASKADDANEANDANDAN
jgi:hypothetical protein